MFIVYDFIFLIVAIVYLPVYLIKRKFHPGFLSRLGIMPGNLEFDNPIWVHAVSVGETMAVKVLLEELRRVYPGKRIVISTVTATGNKVAKGIAAGGDFVTYLPLDFSFIVSRVIEKIRPCVFVLAETEIWPNLINCLYKKHIPVITVNGRISDSSFKGYLSIKFMLSRILRKVSLFCVQGERDADRLSRLGVSGDRIQVTGNMKFDIKDYAGAKTNRQEYRSRLFLGEGEKLLVAGSTHPGEEEIILACYRELLAEFPNLKLLIAPRHPERAKEIEGIVSKYGFHCVLASKLPEKPCNCITKPVFVLDVIGELLNFYSASDLVFVGGSLVKKGGQNILEPGSLEKPVLSGPHIFNFRDIFELFIANKAAAIVKDQREVITKVKELMNDPGLAAGMGRSARQLILKNQGASLRNAENIGKLIVRK